MSAIRIAAILLAGASLTACVSTDMGGQNNGLGPRYSTREPSRQAPEATQSAYAAGRLARVSLVQESAQLPTTVSVYTTAA